jgi:hypothetical protein
MVSWNLWTNGYTYDISTLGNYSMTRTSEWVVSMWTISHEQENIFEKYSMPCHGTFLIYLFTIWKYYVTWKNIPWLAMECFMMSHAWFVLGSTMFYWFWTWVWPIKLSKIASCEGLKAKEGCICHPLCNQCG